MSQKQFSDQVAIITGAGQGIGFEIAAQLAINGASVILNDADEALANRAAEFINSHSSNCIAVPGDASNIAIIERMVATAVNNFGRLTLAVANAGLSLYGDFLTYSQPDFEKVLKVNLGGSFFLAQAFAKQVKNQGGNGSLLFMSSVAGEQALKDLAAYAMTKAALQMLAKNLVGELSVYDIRVNSLAPGATLTERTMEFDNYEKEWSKITPLGRPATVGDIANAALFLLSPSSRHITGHCLIVDGGWTSVSPLPPNQ